MSVLLGRFIGALLSGLLVARIEEERGARKFTVRRTTISGITVDATLVEPGASAGIETFCYGLVTGLCKTGESPRILVEAGRAQPWLSACPGLVATWMDEVSVRLTSTSRIQRYMRRSIPTKSHTRHALVHSSPDPSTVDIAEFRFLRRNVLPIPSFTHRRPAVGRYRTRSTSLPGSPSFSGRPTNNQGERFLMRRSRYILAAPLPGHHGSLS